jgi:membrane complex biogenesis BtpA family protein
VIAGVHFLPLPGSPDYDRAAGMRAIVERAREEVRVLAGHGVDGILFANEADVPYLRQLGPETVAAFAEAAGEAARDLAIPFGVNALLDPVAGVAIAHAAGGRFVRGYFAGAFVTDVGLMDTRGAEAVRLRANLGARDVLVLHNLVCSFGVALVERPKGEEAHGARVHAGVDAFTISGRAATFAPDPELFAEVRGAVPGSALVAGTGVSLENVARLLAVADGVIVVSSLRRDGRTLDAVDPARVDAFMKAARAAAPAR